MTDRARLHLLADDLTGALDSAAAFASDADPVPVFWLGSAPPAGTAALDLATREGDRQTAATRHRACAAWLAEAAVPFKKIDSLLRGHVVDEVIACMADGLYERAVVAPAFPFQRRVTRGGAQFHLAADGEPIAVGVEIAKAFAAAGVPAAVAPADGRPGPGVTVVDAETDADLDAAVEQAGHGEGRTLWVGTGGLAGALARNLGLPRRCLPGFAFDDPLLCLIGTNHPATLEQIRLAEAEDPGVRVVAASDLTAAVKAVQQRLDAHGAAILTVEAGPRSRTADAIGRTLGEVAGRLGRPFTLFVAGGETLRGVAQALGASHLTVFQAREPGVPLSVLKDGAFDGTRVLSKSGAFGTTLLLRDLVAAARSDLRELGKI